MNLREFLHRVWEKEKPAKENEGLVRLKKILEATERKLAKEVGVFDDGKYY